MSRPFLDSETNKWKWGTRGEAIYKTKDQCSKAGIDFIINALRKLRDKLNKTISNHGK